MEYYFDLFLFVVKKASTYYSRLLFFLIKEGVKNPYEAYPSGKAR